MNITKSDFKKLEAVRSFLPAGRDLEALPEEDRQIILDFDEVLLNLYKKARRDNERARLYMSEKRKEAGDIRDLWQKIIDETPCVEVWPGWCTTYKTYNKTVEAIEEAYKNMLSEIEKIPVEIVSTWTPEEVKA